MDRDKSVALPLLESMTKALKHRGPDGQHVHIERFAGLGHSRLAIIDRSLNARQPISNEDNTVWIVCNGEVYNHKSHRRNLELKGHRFKSLSDIEVVLHLYEEFGEDCLAHLRGMFAFAIWDQRQAKLFMARDRLGQKPLYYSFAPGRFLFASEVKALLQDSTVQRKPDLKALHHYLSLGYVPREKTAFESIHKLLPAHKLVHQGGRTRTSCYWKLSYASPRPGTARLNLIDVREEIIDKLQESVRMRLMSDVPPGAFLSGGIDSSTVVALMSQAMNRPVKTFSIGFIEKSHDESEFARSVAELLHTEHHEYTLRPDILTILPEIVTQYDEPLADPSIVPSYYLAKMASQHVTVVLNGDGGDENFAGYDRYVKNKVATYYHRIPRQMRRIPAMVLGKITPRRLSHDHLIKRLESFSQLETSTPARLYCHWLFIFDEQEKRKLCTEEFIHSIGDISTETFIAGLVEDSDGKGITEAALHADVLTYLPDDLLVKMDRACMAHSLENRSPFLDHSFMEYVAGLPESYKLRGLGRKWILKEAAGTILPKTIVHRSKKGFGIPVDRWLRNELKEMVHDILMSNRAIGRGYFRKETVQAIIDQHMLGRRNWQFQLWNLLILELWHREFIDRPQAL